MNKDQKENIEVLEESKKDSKSFKEQFKGDGNPESQQQRPITKEETIKFYKENLPFMEMQDKYEELAFKFHERKIRSLELQVREIEAIGYLAQWKAGQDDAKSRKEAEEKMKAEWDAMTPEQQEEMRQKAKANLENIDKQVKEAEKANQQ